MASIEDTLERNPMAHHTPAAISAIAGPASTTGLAPFTTDSPMAKTGFETAEHLRELSGESVDFTRWRNRMRRQAISLGIRLGLPRGVAIPATRDANQPPETPPDLSQVPLGQGVGTFSGRSQRREGGTLRIYFKQISEKEVPSCR